MSHQTAANASNLFLDMDKLLSPVQKKKGLLLVSSYQKDSNMIKNENNAESLQRNRLRASGESNFSLKTDALNKFNNHFISDDIIDEKDELEQNFLSKSNSLM